MKLTDEQREIAKSFITQDQSNIRGMQDARLHIGQLKTWGKRLYSSEQAWKEEADKILEANERLSNKVQIESKAAYDARREAEQLSQQLKGIGVEQYYALQYEYKECRTKLNKAVRVIEELTLDDTSEKAQKANQFLSSLSQEGGSHG